VPAVDIFVHIPKTAGTTLVRILHREYDELGYLWIPPETRFEDAKRLVADSSAEEFRLIHGHIPVGIHEALTRPARYFTLLRNPVDRALSHYYYVKRHPEHRLYKEVVEKGMTLRDYVTSGITGELANGQTALLAGHGRDAPSGDLSILRRAQENIEAKFAAVGLTEDFERSIVLFKLTLGWRKPLVYESANVSQDRPHVSTIPSKTIEAIKAQSELDEALYRFARERLDAQIRDAGPTFERELRKLRLGNALYRHGPKPALRWGWNLTRRLLSSTDPVRGTKP
jgi:hypothetical protein